MAENLEIPEQQTLCPLSVSFFFPHDFGCQMGEEHL